jgi:hypothetical protein
MNRIIHCIYLFFLRKPSMTYYDIMVTAKILTVSSNVSGGSRKRSNIV